MTLPRCLLLGSVFVLLGAAAPAALAADGPPKPKCTVAGAPGAPAGGDAAAALGALILAGAVAARRSRR